MATYTSNFALTKPDYGETADIAVINGNMDEIDEIMHDNRYMMADAWSSSVSYAVGDLCIYENALYKCVTATSGNWDASKWTLTVLADNIGSVTVSKTATGNPIEITDGADAPMVSCVTEIQGYQSGTGTPSPDNIRPIVAYTEGNVVVRGKNLCDDDNFTIGLPGYQTGENIDDFHESVRYAFSEPIYAKNGLVISAKSDTREYFDALLVIRYDANGTFISMASQIMSVVGTVYTISVPANSCEHIRVCAGADSTHNITTSVQGYIQVETGSSATAYEPYSGTTYTTTYPTAIYRGSEDVAEGEVTAEWGYIASYAGETLPGEWISDRDEYVAGTTPTTGAQVAYALSTPTTSTVTVSNSPIRTLSGYSHIESTTGNVEVEYITQTYEPIIKVAESELGEKYSTSERVVGTWIDGKPLYEQTIIFQNAVNLTANTFTNVYDLSTVDLESLVEITPYTDNVAPLRPFGYFIPDITSAKMLRMNVPNVGWYIGGMTIRYTKTTD